MRNYSRITQEPDCFDVSDGGVSDCDALRAASPGEGGVPGGGKGPILRIVENDKAPTMLHPPDRSNTDATFIVPPERHD